MDWRSNEYVKHDRAPEPWEGSYRKLAGGNQFERGALAEITLPKHSVFDFLQGLRESQRNPDYAPTSRIGKLIKSLMDLAISDDREDRDETGSTNPDRHLSSGVEYRTVPSNPFLSPAEPAIAPAVTSRANDNSGPPILAAAQAMASGTSNRENSRLIEQGTIDLLRAANLENPSSSIDRALSILKADGDLNGNEYKVFQQLVARSGVDLNALGIADAKQIDTSQELGVVMTAMIQKREQQSGRD